MAAEGMPVPLSGTMRGELASEHGIVRLPVREPVVAGVKVTVTEQLAPGASEVLVQGLVAT